MVTYTYRYHTGTPNHATKKDKMAQKPITYEETLTGYMFWSGSGNETENASLNNIIKRDTELREAGWVPVQGAFSLSAPPNEKSLKLNPTEKQLCTSRTSWRSMRANTQR